MSFAVCLFLVANDTLFVQKKFELGLEFVGVMLVVVITLAQVPL